MPGLLLTPHKQVIGHRHQDHLAVEPLGAMRVISAGISTCRPAESVIIRVSTFQGVVARLLAAAANQQAQAQRQYQRYPPLSTRSLHCFSSVILICISRSPKRAPHHGGSLFYRKFIVPSAPAKENILFAKQNIIPYGGTLYAL